MIQLFFFLLFAVVIGIGFGIFAAGDRRAKIRQGAKVFAEFVGIGLVLAWICYLLPL